jgi:hypothetical protein
MNTQGHLSTLCSQNDGQLNENAIQEYAECMKELLPPDLLESLMRKCIKKGMLSGMLWRSLFASSLECVDIVEPFFYC